MGQEYLTQHLPTSKSDRPARHRNSSAMRRQKTSVVQKGKERDRSPRIAIPQGVTCQALLLETLLRVHPLGLEFEIGELLDVPVALREQGRKHAEVQLVEVHVQAPGRVERLGLRVGPIVRSPLAKCVEPSAVHLVQSDCLLVLLACGAGSRGP